MASRPEQASGRDSLFQGLSPPPSEDHPPLAPSLLTISWIVILNYYIFFLSNISIPSCKQ